MLDKMAIKNSYLHLRNGVKIPKIGFGTWQIPNGELAYQSVLTALKNGYIHIDSANAYGNEVSVGKAIKDSGLPRESIFVTSKLPAEIKNFEDAKESFLKTLENFGLDYIDLYLIHAPWPWHAMGSSHKQGNLDVWKAMEMFYKEGKIRAIGVSNFSPSDMQNIIDHSEIKPFVNQIGFWVGRDQEETLVYCKKHNILVEAYSPLATGRILNEKPIVDLANKYKVSPAQLCIRYCVQRHTIPLPKSTHEQRIIENANIDFNISNDDLEYLSSLSFKL